MNALATPSVHEFINSTGMAFKVRALVIEGKEWFPLSDICEVLGLARNNRNGSYANHTISIPEEEKTVLFATKNSGSKRRTLSLSESGLYRLIMRSNKPDARPFQDWVTKVVLPTIRKEGVYVREGP